MIQRNPLEPPVRAEEEIEIIDGLPVLYGEGTGIPDEYPVIDGLPVIYEEEEDGTMGDTEIHLLTMVILHLGIQAHLKPRSAFRVYANMNVYYHRRAGKANISPDTMVVKPIRDLHRLRKSYRIPQDGPAPFFAAEVLSDATAEKRDKRAKVVAYAELGVSEYALVDVTGEFLGEQLLLKRLRKSGTYRDEPAADGGITSRLGFRLCIEDDGLLRVSNARTGERYLRPSEIQDEVQARRAVERQLEQLRSESEQAIQRLKAEVERLKQKIKKKPGKR